MFKSEVSNTERRITGSDNIARTLVFKVFEQLQNAALTVSECNGETYQFGDKTADCQAQLIIHHPAVYRRLLSGGCIAAGEAYIDGWWDSPDITQVVRALARNMALLDRIEDKVGWITRLKDLWLHRKRRNSRQAARENILAHYDLGNEFYRTFLDPNMLYSAAIYDDENTTLAQAQIAKMDRLCRKLHLTQQDHLLEIGTGWGALAIYAAREYGCRVTTTTISEAQYQWAKERIQAEGLEHRITLLRDDYRDLTGQYDKIVSVEMIEAVGQEYLTTYLQKCQSLLKPNGMMAIQAITIADQRYDKYSQGVDFIQKHIFPGGFLPSITAVANELTRHTDFVVRDIRDIGLDYAKTLADWHHMFNQQVTTLKQQGFDERFIRMWRYYLCYCEGGFLERTISTIQLVATRRDWR